MGRAQVPQLPASPERPGLQCCSLSSPLALRPEEGQGPGRPCVAPGSAGSSPLHVPLELESRPLARILFPFISKLCRCEPAGPRPEGPALGFLGPPSASLLPHQPLARCVW